MIGKNNQYLKNKKEGTKVETYSIKKFKVGTASVVIGASIFFGAGAVAQASEEVSNNTTSDNTTNSNASEGVAAAPVATAQPVAKETTKEDVAAAVAAKLSGETAQEVKALDKTKLENYIAEIEAKLADGTYANKTEESVAVLKEALKVAKDTLENAKTQEELTKAYNKLVTTANTKLKNKPVEKKEAPAVDTTNGQPTVGKKAENTEKKSESNSIENTGSNDPRNGKALDKNNAFRAEVAYSEGTNAAANGHSDAYILNDVNKATSTDDAVNAVSRVTNYKVKYNKDASGKITSLDWLVFYNDHAENLANAYNTDGGDVYRNFIQIPAEVNMPTSITRAKYNSPVNPKFINGKVQRIRPDGSALSNSVTFENPAPATAAGLPLDKKDAFALNSGWESTLYGRSIEKLVGQEDRYFKSASSDSSPRTKQLVYGAALNDKRLIVDRSTTGGDGNDAYVWSFRTAVPETTTNEQLKDMKVVFGMMRSATAGANAGFANIATNPVKMWQSDVSPEPTAKDQTVKVGQKPDATKSIGNLDTLPKGTTVKYKDAVDTQTPGEKRATAVVTYPDTSTKEVPVKVIVEEEAVATTKPVITTSLTGKANTKTPVEVSAEPGATVSLFAHDGTKLGSAVANDQGVASITPTENIPAGKVTATATKTGKKSVVSDSVEATPATDAATNKPAAGAATSGTEIVNNLAGKASTPADVTVKVPAGSTVKLYNTDGVVIGEAVANAQGVATVHPTNSLPAGEITATSTPVGGKESAKSAPITVTASPVTVKDGGVTRGDDNTQLLVNRSHITVYPGDPVKVDVIAASNAIENFSVPKNPTAISGVLPVGEFLTTAGGKTYKQRNAAYQGTVAETQKSGDTDVTFSVTSKKGVTVTRDLKVTVLETAKKYEPVAGKKVDVADSNNLSGDDKNKVIAAVKAANPSLPANATYSVDEKGNLTITYPDGSTDKIAAGYLVNPTTPAAQPTAPATSAVAPTVEIPYSDKATKEVYVYGGEENSFDIKFKDDSGKIVSATVRQGGNKEFASVPGETNKISTQYGYTANTITTETPATDANPAVITYRGTPAATDGLAKDKLEAATKGENPEGMALGWRYATATDADGAFIENKAVGSSNATDPGAFRVMLKPQTQKYDIKTPAEADKVAVSDANNITDAEFNKIKEKVKLEYSETNPDKNLESKRGEEVTDKTAKIDTIKKDGNNLVVTYKDGSIDKKPLAEFARTNVAPTLDIPYSNKEEKQIYLYTTEESDISLKVKDDSGKVKEAVLKFPGGQNESYMDGKNKAAMYLKQEGMTTSEVTASEDAPHEIKLTGAIPKGAWGLNSNTGMTRILYAKDTDDKDTSASFDNNKSVNGYIRFVLKDQTTKYDIKTLDAENKIAVNNANDLTDADLKKIKNKLKIEYAQTNNDARLADKKGKEVEDASKVVDKVEKDGDNLVVTYKDGSKDTKPISDVVRTNNAPEVKIPYSVDGKKDVYVYANEDFDIPVKFTDDSGKIVSATIRQGGNRPLSAKDAANPNVIDNEYGMTFKQISEETTATTDKPATVNIVGNLTKETPGLTASSFPTDEKGEYPIVTRYATATDTDGRNISNNATSSSYANDPGAFRIVLKAQTAKYDVKELDDANKTVVSNTAALTPEDLATVKENLQLEYSKKNKDKNINKDEAVTPENVKKAVDKVEQKGENLEVTYKDGSKDTIPVDKVAKLDKQPAIDEVTKKANDQIAAINGNDSLTKAEKDKAIADVNKGKDAALEKIADATNATDVNAAKDEGTGAVAKVNPVAKEKAKQAIADELKAKNNELDTRKDLSDAEKKAAKDEAKKLADAQLAEIAKQPDNKPTAAEAAEAQKVVDAAKDKGVADVKTVNPIAKEKAKKDVADELAKKEKEIDARTDLTKEEKDKAKEEAKGLAKKATDAINAQPDKAATPAEAKTAQDAVDAAKKTGVAEVKAVNPPANKKATAKDAVANDAEAKKQAIQGDNTLSDAAKEKLKKEVDDIKEATDAAITGAKKNADVDKAKKAGETAIAAINSARVPANKLVAENPTNLTPDEQDKLKKAIEAVNPGATVEVKPDGSAVVTYPGKAPETLKQADLTKSPDALDNPGGGNNINRPVDKVIVKDPKNLTPEEKAKIKQAVRDVNPNAVVTMDDNGTVTVSTPEGNTAAFPAEELVRTLEDAAKPDSANTGIRKPADKKVGDATNPTDQAEVTEKLKKLNGSDTKVKYDDEGNATVIRPDGTIATIPASDLFKTPEDAKKANGGDDINKPNSQTVVADKNALTPDEKKAIEDKVKAVNPGAVVTVDEKGNATVTTPEGKTAVIDADDLVKGADEKTSPKAGNNINNPADRVQVADKANLTPEEIAKIKAAVEAVNPGSTVVVDEKGNATVTTPEGKTATIPVSELVKTPTDKDEVSGGNQVNTPADRVVVENPAALTDKEKEAIKAKIQAVNPGADVVFDNNGNATVTTPEGKTATIPASDLVKPKADLADPTKQDAVNKPADKVVVDPALVAADKDLPQDAKDKIKAAVEAVNPGSTVVVDDKGNATVTTPSGKTVVIPKADLVKTEADKETAKAGNNINKPADKVVADKDALTPENIEAIKAKVEAVNPGATVVVDDKGNATVVTPDGQTATIPVTDLVKSPEEAKDAKAGNNVNKPADKVSANKDALTPEDIKAIKAKVEAVNPGSTVVVDDKGNATVSTPDGKTATIPVEDLVKDPAAKETPNAGNKVNTPADKVVVKDPAKLTDEEKKAIKDKVKAVNPDAKVVFDDKGNATVTTKDGAVATIPASDLAKTASDLTNPEKQDAVKKPADKTLVKDPAKLTQAEKDAIKAAVAKVNPESATVVVDDKGNATVTTPEGKTEVIPASDLVKTAKEAEGANAGNNINKPADKVSATSADLTGDKKDEVKDKIKKAVEAVNPGATVFVDDKGNATVTTPEGDVAVIPAADLTKSAADAGKANAGNAVNTPAAKVEVKDPAKLTEAEKKAIEDKVKAVNPGSKVVVDDKGNATVTTPEGKTATIPATDLTKSASDAGKANAGNGANTPATKTVVKDPANLTDEEKAKVKKAVEDVNPGSTVVVNDKGDVIVTKGDGTVLVIPELDLVIPEDKLTDPTQQNGVNTPATRVLVGDKAKLTADEIEKVKESIKAVNPGSTVVVDENGNATVTTPEGKTATIPAAQLVKDAKDVAAKNNGENINVDFEKETVADLNNLTDAEKEAAKAKIKGANADVVEVIFDKAGNATVITKDGKVYTIVSKDIFKQRSSTDNGSSANTGQIVSEHTNARKGAKELPYTGTADSTVAMVAAAASALLGLGLAGRRRKEDEEA